MTRHCIWVEMRGLLPDPVQGFISMPDLLQLDLRGRIPVVWLPFWAFRTPGRSTEFLSAEKRNCLYCAIIIGYLSKRFLKWTLDSRCFSSSLTLREVMEPSVDSLTFRRIGRASGCQVSGSYEVVCLVKGRMAVRVVSVVHHAVCEQRKNLSGWIC